MGQAKRRKLAGCYPEQTQKPRSKGRFNPVVVDEMEYFPMMFTTMAILSGKMGRSSREMNSNG